jgi:hypothetical protein
MHYLYLSTPSLVLRVVQLVVVVVVVDTPTFFG